MYLSESCPPPNHHRSLPTHRLQWRRRVVIEGSMRQGGSRQGEGLEGGGSYAGRASPVSATRTRNTHHFDTHAAFPTRTPLKSTTARSCSLLPAINPPLPLFHAHSRHARRLPPPAAHAWPSSRLLVTPRAGGCCPVGLVGRGG
jgi:hypothetical protein